MIMPLHTSHSLPLSAKKNTMPSSDDHLGNHAQTNLRQAISVNGNDWDRDSRKRAQLITELQSLDQKIAGYEQRHREYSTALAILEKVLPSIHQHTTAPTTPTTPEEFENTLIPNRAALPYTVTITETGPTP